MPQQHRYRADDARTGLRGAVELIRTPEGLRPRRLASEVWSAIPHAYMNAMAECAAGVRLRFATEARTIALTLMARPVLQVDSANELPAVVDVLVDGEVIRSQPVGRGLARVGPGPDCYALDAGTTETVEVSGLAPSAKVIEIWLPHTAVVDLGELVTDAPVVAVDSGPRWLHYGSSISHCFEASTPTRTWPSIVARQLGLDLIDLGFAGAATLDPSAAQTIRDVDADLITLKLGINLVNSAMVDQPQFEALVHGFLDTIRSRHAETPIVVFSPIVCPVIEDVPGPTQMDADGRVINVPRAEYSPNELTLTSVRRCLADIVAARSAEDRKLDYVDGRALFDLADVEHGRLPDGIHPDEEGYRLMAERAVPILAPYRALRS